MEAFCGKFDPLPGVIPGMAIMKRFPVWVTILFTSALPAADGPVFLEKKGIVAIEAESTQSRLGKWIQKKDVAGFSGECHLEFTGNKPESGPAHSPLEYSFKITKPGIYQLSLRARKRLEGKREDISNDCYVALEGDFEAGGEAALAILRKDNKMFGGSPDGWAWATQLDVEHKKFPALYRFKEGETYRLTISGRSRNFNLDRILFVHEDENLRKVQGANPAESPREGGESVGSKLPPRPTKRRLTNSEGKTIEAELVSKSGDTLVALVQGKRFEIPISSLSQSDQDFLKDWER
jgi:hypothetical protein